MLSNDQKHFGTPRQEMPIFQTSKFKMPFGNQDEKKSRLEGLVLLWMRGCAGEIPEDLILYLERVMESDLPAPPSFAGDLLALDLRGQRLLASKGKNALRAWGTSISTLQRRSSGILRNPRYDYVCVWCFLL